MLNTAHWGEFISVDKQERERLLRLDAEDRARKKLGYGPANPGLTAVMVGAGACVLSMFVQSDPAGVTFLVLGLLCAVVVYFTGKRREEKWSWTVSEIRRQLEANAETNDEMGISERNQLEVEARVKDDEKKEGIKAEVARLQQTIGRLDDCSTAYVLLFVATLRLGLKEDDLERGLSDWREHPAQVLLPTVNALSEMRMKLKADIEQLKASAIAKIIPNGVWTHFDYSVLGLETFRYTLLVAAFPDIRDASTVAVESVWRRFRDCHEYLPLAMQRFKTMMEISAQATGRNVAGEFSTHLPWNDAEWIEAAKWMPPWLTPPEPAR